MTTVSLLAALKAFDSTARLGSVSAAARALGLRQPTLSAHIARLQREYDVELFHRRGGRLELTPLGHALRESSHRIFQAEADAQALLLAVRSQFSGQLNLCAVGPYNVMPMIRRFRQRRPGVSVAVSVGDSRQVVERIADHRGDVGVLVHAVADDTLHCVPYRRQPLVIFAAREHPLAARSGLRLRDLEAQEFVLREPGSTTRRMFEQALQAAGVRVRSGLEAGSREAVREAVALGLGLGVVADTAYVPDPRLLRLDVAGFEAATHVHVICRRERRAAPLVAAFFEVVDELRAR